MAQSVVKKGLTAAKIVQILLGIFLSAHLRNKKRGCVRNLLYKSSISASCSVKIQRFRVFSGKE